MSEVNTVTINKKIFNLPPLNAGQVRKHWPALVECIASLDAGSTADKVAGFGDLVTNMADLVFIALKNEYPHITADDVDTLMVPELQSAIQGVIASTGLGNTAQPGEAKAPKRR